MNGKWKAVGNWNLKKFNYQTEGIKIMKKNYKNMRNKILIHRIDSFQKKRRTKQK